MGMLFSRRFGVILMACIFLMMGLPMLVGYGVIPYTNFGVEVVAVIGLGLLLVASSVFATQSAILSVPVQASLAMGVGLAMWILLKSYWRVAPAGVGVTTLIYVGYVLGLCGAIWVGSLMASVAPRAWLEKVLVGVLAVAAVIAAIGSAMQYFGVDGAWMGLSPAVDPGRTYGFVRQPNHQSTFLTMALAGLLYLRVQGRLKGWTWYSVAFLLIAAVISTGSRTGMLNIFALVLLYFIVLRGSLRSNGLRAGTEVLFFFAFSWVLLSLGSLVFQREFYGLTKLSQTGNEGIGLRKDLWLGTFSMIMQNPFVGHAIRSFMPTFMLEGHVLSTGVVFENAHNMFLQLAFEFGLPVAVIAYSALGWLVISIFRNFNLSNAARLFGSILLPILVYAQFEYPLWYSHFLFPFGFFVGAYLAEVAPRSAFASDDNCASTKGLRFVEFIFAVVLGLSLIVGGVTSNRDFYRVTPFFARFDASSLKEKIERAGPVFWFSNVVDLAKLQAAEVKSDALTDDERLSLIARLGCEHDEPWYQLSTLKILAERGYVADVKWMLYMMSKLNPNSLPRIASYFEGSDASWSAGLVAFAEQPLSVLPSHQFFDIVCGR